MTITTTTPKETPSVPTSDVKGAAPEAKAEVVKAVKGKKKRVVRQVPRGNAYIQATYNNTIITITDPNGNALGWGSAGMAGFKGPKKATPYAASIVAKNVIDKVADYGVKEVSIFVKGIGGGREGAIRALHTNGLNVVSINDVTPIPHNGCRPPKRRRV
ncbi:30S ribosomal protein S11 [Patescibacteria group bacterium]|nr:30S ribosomal protein S11 [Patescibacteria group bacterium]MBU1613113.1 30S ribosomal protein S11 [Patescibacteria group bacterium]